jgi:alkanesulfonate monooxygenase SsuD/methylene tetrahydromethanopterin reductase-like flavin-dependent oxidoreductase (luciferase family)
VKAIVPMFSKESWEFHGQYYDFPARNVIPKPFQKPHPPLWVACSNIQTIGKAGEWGMGALGFTFVTPEAARAWVHRYYNNLLNNSNKLADYPSNPNVAMVSGFMCAPTDEEAEAKAAGWTFFIFALSYYGRKGVDAPGTSNLWEEYQAWRGGPEEKKALDSGLIGSPETIRRKLRQFQASRSGDPAEPGRQDQPRGHLFLPRPLRARGDAGVPCGGGRACRLEAEGAVARDRARGPGCREVRHLQPPERTHRPSHAGAAEAEDG